MEIKCKGNPDISLYLGMTTVLILCAGGIAFIAILNLGSVIAGLVLISISLFAFSRFIQHVNFGEKITVKYFIGKSKTVEYKQCKKMYKANDGMIYAPINVLKYDDNGSERKITFVCNDSDLELICNEYFDGFIPKFR